MNKAVFLDRDGVINSNRDRYYVWKKEELELNPGVAAALKSLKEKGFLLIVVTNQGGVGRGLFSRKAVEKLHRQINRELKAQGTAIDDFYYCPHHEEKEACLCRKPLPLMLQKAMARYRIDPGLSWFIGDSRRDMEAGKAAGLHTLLVAPNGNLEEAVKRIG
jgi:D-glycero-D-manno-heptose 1,7-bisphosphate phosphatase